MLFPLLLSLLGLFMRPLMVSAAASVRFELVGGAVARMNVSAAMETSGLLRSLFDNPAGSAGIIPMPHVSMEEFGMISRYLQHGRLPSSNARWKLYAMVMLADYLDVQELMDRLADAINADPSKPGTCSSSRVVEFIKNSSASVGVPLPVHVACDIATRMAKRDFQSKCIESLVRGNPCVSKALWGHLSSEWFSNSSVPSSRSVDLRGNNIESVKEWAFTGFANLATLYLQDNKIHCIHKDAFRGLTSLTYLELSSNLVPSIGKGLFNAMPSLATLSIDGNRIQSIEKNAFEGMPSLQHLYLQGNRLELIEKGVLDGMAALTLLRLQNNRIHSIAKSAFNDLARLTKLSLSGNRIQTIEKGVFDGLLALKTLWLDGNQIQSIESGALEGAPSLDFLYVAKFISRIEWRTHFGTCSSDHAAHESRPSDCLMLRKGTWRIIGSRQSARTRSAGCHL